METFNDTLELYVKKDKSSDIIKSYEAFGWNVASHTENSKYEDLVDLTFERPHDIKNKDELQLMQVYLDDRLEQIGKLQKKKHAKSTSFGLTIGPFSMLLITLSLLLFIHDQSLSNILLGSLMIVVGLAFIVLEIIILPKLYKKENEEYSKRHSTLKYEISNLCTYAQTLIGGVNEKD